MPSHARPRPPRALRLERYAHRSVHTRAAGHARVVRRQIQPLERLALVVAHRRQGGHAIDDPDRVGAAHAHAAARLDREVVRLGDLEQRRSRRDRDTQIRRLEGDLGLLGAVHFLQRGARRLSHADRLTPERLLNELALLAPCADEPDDGRGEQHRPEAPHAGVGRAGAEHDLDPVPVEEVEGDGAEQ